jgi:hypothetical protein
MIWFLFRGCENASFAVLDFLLIKFVTMTALGSMPKTARSRLSISDRQHVIDLVSVLQESLQKSKSKSAVYRQAGLKKP